MRFKEHYNLQGKHAFLSPSSYHWINYDDDKLTDRFTTAMAAARGTALHEFAKDAIELGVPLADNGQTISLYVNDAIEYRMTPEQVLYYSDNCFGTADAISFNGRFLRIHDLKTGVSPTSEHQLEIYAAIFCLEYGHNPFDLQMETRIYQSDEIRCYEPDPGDIIHIMDTIIQFDKRIELLKDSM